MKMNKIFTAALVLITVFVASREAHDEWLAKQGVESKSRAMFSGSPIAWKSESSDAGISLQNNS